MNLPAALFVIRWMIRDTFRQSLAARTFWLLLALTGVCVLFCLSVSVEGPRSLKPPGEYELFGSDKKPLTERSPRQGHIKLAFGALRFELFRDARSEVEFLEALLGKYVGGGFGTLIMLVFTAGFMPEFLLPSAASVLLAKPLPRWSIVVGKYLGVLTFVLFQVALFVGGTWLALGLRTGVWPAGYLLSIPVLWIHFGMIYSFSALLAVATRSTVASVFGAVLFWMVCCGINYGRDAALALPYLSHDRPALAASTVALLGSPQGQGPLLAGSALLPGRAVGPAETPLPGAFQALLDVGYWIMPKPLDLMMILDNALGAGEHVQTIPELEQVQRMGLFYPELSVLSSILAAAVILGIAAWQLAVTEY
jgi:hypothetical protein